MGEPVAGHEPIAVDHIDLQVLIKTTVYSAIALLNKCFVDFVEYRRKVDNRAVKKNCTIPYWLSVAADKAGINYSRVLQDAIIALLGVKKAY